MENSSTYYRSGRYRCRVISQSFTEAKTGTPQFVLRFHVLKAIEPPGEYHVWERRTFYALTDKTIEFVMRDLRTLGYPGDSLEGLAPETECFFNFAGHEVELQCSHEQDRDGKLRERWGAPRIERRLDKEKLQALDKLLRKQAKTNVPVSGNYALQVSEDDIPF